MSGSDTRVRFATVDDAEQILSIYSFYCTDSPITFETEPPTVADIRSRIESKLKRYPWLVGEKGGEVVGYAYAGPHHERVAYRWSVDCSVYIAAGAKRTGLGRELYTRLFTILKHLGYYQVFACITLPNAPSVGIHEKMGFEPAGVHRSAGYKLGSWHDVGWWQLALRPPSGDAPKDPTPLPASLPERQLLLAL